MTRYGYIGLGMMGSAMAENLLGSGAQVTVYDIDEAAVAVAVSQGGLAASSPAEVAVASDVVSICVPAASHLETVMTGDEGLVEGAHEGLSILVHSTVSPETIRVASATAAQQGSELFDACVAGGTEIARTGDQLVLAGGVDEMGEAAQGLLAIYAKRIINAGPVGAGAALKIAVNVMTYAQFAAAATSYDLMVGADADPEALFEAWREIGQLTELTEHFVQTLQIPPDHLTDELRTRFATLVGIGEKDLSLAIELGETRAGTHELLQALHLAMPALYNITEE